MLAGNENSGNWLGTDLPERYLGRSYSLSGETTLFDSSCWTPNIGQRTLHDFGDLVGIGPEPLK